MKYKILINSYIMRYFIRTKYTQKFFSWSYSYSVLICVWFHIVYPYNVFCICIYLVIHFSVSCFVIISVKQLCFYLFYTYFIIWICFNNWHFPSFLTKLNSNLFISIKVILNESSKIGLWIFVSTIDCLS